MVLRNRFLSIAARLSVYLGVFLFLFFFQFAFSSIADAATLYWVGGAGDNVGTNANDWSTTNPASCADGAGDASAVPSTLDIAVFDADCDSSANIAANWSVAGIQIDSGYIGTLTQGTGSTLTVGTSDFIQAGGTFTGGDSAIDLNDAFTLSGGTFNATSGNMTVANQLTVSGSGSFNEGTGTVTFDGTTTTLGVVDVVTSETFNNMTVNVTTWLYIANLDTLTVNGTLTLTNGGVVAGASGQTATLNAKGPISVASTFDGGFNNSSQYLATLLIDGAGDQSFAIPAGAAMPKTTLNQSATTISFSGAGTVTWDAALTLQAGTFNAGSITLDMNGDVIISGGTFNADSSAASMLSKFTVSGSGTFNEGTGTVTFDGTSTTADVIDVVTSETFNNMTVNATTWLYIANLDTLIVNGTLTLTNGGVIAVGSGGTATLNAKGPISVASTFDGGYNVNSTDFLATLLIDGAGDQSFVIPAGAAMPKTTLNQSATTISSSGAGTVTWDAAVVITSGILDASGVNQTFSGGGTIGASGTLRLQGGETVTTPTLDIGSTVIYNGTGSYVTSLAAGNTYSNLTFNGSGGVWEPSAAVTVNSNLTITAGTFDIDGQNLTVTGTFSNDGTLRLLGSETTVSLTMDTNSGTIEYDGISSYTGLKLGNTYYNLTFGNTGTWTLNAALDVNGTLTLADVAGTLSVSGTNYGISAGGWTDTGTFSFTEGSGTVTFDATGTINSAETFATVVFNSAGTSTVTALTATAVTATAGTVNLGSGTLTVNGTLTVQGATVDGQTGTIDINDGNFSMTSGIFTVPSTAFTIERNFTLTAGTFNNSNSITFDDSSVSDSTTITYAGTVPGTVVITKDSAGTITVASGTTVNLGASPTSIVGGFTSGGSINNGTITISSGTWTLELGGGNFTNNGTITHSGSGWDMNNGTGGQLVNSSGATITYAGTAITLEGDFTQSGTFDLTGKTLTLDSDSGNDDAIITVTANGGVLGGTVVINKGTGANVAISSGTTINLGTGPTSVFGGNVNNTNDGTIIIDSGTWVMTLSSNSLINNGTITHSGNGWDINGATSGGLTNSSGATITYAGTSITNEVSFAQNGTFDMTGKTITFDGTADTDDSTISGTSTINGNVIINKTHASGNTTLGSDVTISGNFTRTDGPITNPASAYTLTVQGNISTTTTDTFGGANLTLAMGGGNNQTITDNTGVTIASPLQINKSANTASLATNMTTGSTCNVVEGTFDINGKTFTCGSTFTVEDGGNLELFGTSGESLTTPTLNSGSTVTYTGDGDGLADTITVTTLAATYHHLTINSTDGTTDTFTLGAAVDINGTLTLTSGVFSVSGTNYGITVGGGWTDTGAATFTEGTGTVTFDGTGTINSNEAFNSVTINSSGNTITLGNTLTTGGNLTITAGTLSAAGNTIAVTGTFTNSGTLQLNGTEAAVTTPSDVASSGTVAYNNSGAVISFLLGNTYNNLTLGGTGTVTLAAALTINGNLTINSGATLDFNGYDPTITGNFTNSGTASNTSARTFTLNGTTQTFNPSNITIGTLSLTGSSGTVSLGSNFTLSNLLSIAAGRVLSLLTYVITGTSTPITNLGTISEGTGKVVHNSSNLYIADSNFDEDSLISLAVDKVYISITDEDGNLNGASADSLSGIVVSCATDSETVTLTETGAATEVFRNTGLTTALYAGSATDNDGTLACADAVLITATYTDPQDSSDTRSDTATSTSTAPPTAPSSFAGTANSTTQITWTWTDNASNETGFKLYDSSNTLIATISTANATSYAETGLTKGTSYTRKIAAYNAAGNSAYTSTATVSTPAEPNAPSLFAGVAASNTSITWSWTDNASDETGFKLLDSSNTVIATIATANTTSYTETGLSQNTSYTRKVLAYSSDGDSPASNSATVSTGNNAPGNFALISPADNAVSSTGLPTFSFRKSSVTGGSISSYTLFVGGHSFTGIPASGSASSNPAQKTDYENTHTSKFFSEDDGDSSNDYIAVTIVDGSASLPIADGKYAWYVRAIDANSNTSTTSSRTIHIDATAPAISSITISPGTSKSSTSFTTTSTSPTLTFTATDGRALGEATISLEKANQTFSVITSYTALETRTFSLTGTKETISFTPRANLSLGSSYRYVMSVEDAVGHSTSQRITLEALSSQQQAQETIATLDADETDTDTIVEALREALPDSPFVLPDLTAHAVTKRHLQAEEFGRFLAILTPILNRISGGGERFIYSAMHSLANLFESINRQAIALFKSINESLFQRIIAFLYNINAQTRSIAQTTSDTIITTKESLFASPLTDSFLATLRTFQVQREGLATDRRDNRRNVFSFQVETPDAVKSLAARISRLFHTGQRTRVAQGLKNRQAIDRVMQNIINPVRNTAGEVALKVRSTYELWFDQTPTRIANVRITSLSPTSATIEWNTNHLTRSGKVNYGTFNNQAYDHEAFEAEGLHEQHAVTLSNLDPSTTYYFEVMNQNGGYVYDAYYALTTPSDSGTNPNIELIPQVAHITRDTPAYAQPDLLSDKISDLKTGDTLRALLSQDGWVSVLLPSRKQGWVESSAVQLRDKER